MRTVHIYIFILFIFLPISSATAQIYGNPVVKPEIILKDASSFLNYWHTTMRLSEDYVPLDTSGEIIGKSAFFKKISTGDYLPLLLNSKKKTYKLFKINTPVDIYISSVLSNIGNEEYNNFQWEGKPMPFFHLKDLQGNEFDRILIKGKILVLNFWFIHCISCVQEMPELNKLVAQYKDRKDIHFLGIALDKEDSLKKFIKKNKFDYQIIADTTLRLYKTLGIYGFPAQVLVDKKGNVVKIFSNFYSYQRMIPYLKKEAAKVDKKPL